MTMNRTSYSDFRKTALSLLACCLVLCSSCSRDADLQEARPQRTVTTVHFEGTKAFFDAAGTRAANNDYTLWKDNDVVYIYFSDSKYAIATYSLETGWSAEIAGSIAASGTCHCRHFANAVSYQQAGGTAVLNNKSVDYLAQNVAYTYDKDNGMYLVANMQPNCVRIRFKGSPNQAVSLVGLESPSRFSGSIEDLSCSTAASHLVVESDGYTPYVYGYLGSSGQLTITLDGRQYTKKVTGKELPVGKSAYIDLAELTPGTPSATRATASWATGSTVHLILTSAGKQISGTAQYNGSEWTLTTESTVSPTTSAATCTAGYVSGGTLSGSAYTLAPTSAVYVGTGTYTSTSTDVYVNVTLQPRTSRIRFKGAAGTKISLRGEDNDLKYYASFSTATLQGTKQVQDVELTVNADGYTPYIYAEFSNTATNTLTLMNVSEGNTYVRNDVSGASLTGGQSGFFTIPTNDNYASLMWTQEASIDPNAYVTLEDVVTFTDGMVGAYVIGSTAQTYYATVFKDISSYNTDEELIAEILADNTPDNASECEDMITGWWNRTSSFYQPATTYYYCTVAYNANGVRGPVQKVPFTTRSASEPIAALSNLGYKTADGVDKWTFDVAMSNGAVKYYLNSYDGDATALMDGHWLAYYTYKEIANGGLTYTYSYESVMFDRVDTSVAVLTVAVDGSGNLGNYSCLQGSLDGQSAAPERSLAPARGNTCREGKQQVRRMPRRMSRPAESVTLRK